MNGYTRITLDGEVYETKVINGDLFIPQVVGSTGMFHDNTTVVYLKIESSTIKKLISSANNKVKRSSKRVY